MMKILSKLVIGAAGLLAIASCTKNQIDYGEVEKLTGDETLLKINNVSMYYNNRSTIFKINGKRVSGLLTARSPFPGGGYNTGGDSKPDFLSVPSGDVNLSVVLPKKKDDGTDSLVLYNTTLNLTAGKRYSVHLTDTAAATKSLLTEENFTMPDSTVVRYRFVNLMPNVAAVDVYYGVTLATPTKPSVDSLILSNVPFMQMTPEFKLKAGGLTAGGVLGSWKVRPAGAANTTATVLASYSSASTVLDRRVYTAFACGYSGKTTAAQKPYISFYLVR
ncbi:DUF4397 domain-containing protein [Mucilaginibacter sp. PAMB04274]|uniref:DUF4397 domain-containing protein n=1 Tax=Mucilaginibacter sp. PAMB04274 TaxID=3138568 RepID=UPI0031F60CA1